MAHRKNHTKDEKFMVCLYEAAQKSGDMETEFNRYDIGTLAGLHPKAVDAICKLLVQANFIKKGTETDIFITPHGEKLARMLLIEG